MLENLPYPIKLVHEFDGALLDCSSYHRVVVIAENKLADLYFPSLSSAIARDIDLITFTGGEHNKTRETKARIEDQLIALGCGRDTLLIALGGGLTLDLVGFIAATYYRGIPVIYCPTSLLAMVDATLGGKTGVNTPEGKNLIGCFNQAQMVLINLSTLKSLSARDYLAGMAEVLKHALIADVKFWDQLIQARPLLLKRDSRCLQKVIQQSLEIKARIVNLDYQEQGLRKILNFGHTFAHALEKVLDYEIYHGEAVALGMIFEAQVSYLRGVLNQAELLRLQQGILAFGYRLDWLMGVSFTDIFAAMSYDKKNQAAKIHISLLQSIGQIYSNHQHYCLPCTFEVMLDAFTEVVRLC